MPVEGLPTPDKHALARICDLIKGNKIEKPNSNPAARELIKEVKYE